jgi:outer membrane receptor protein involved in Fe transport
VPSSYSADSLWSYEIGAKDLLFDRRLAIQGSVFFIDWSNIQTSVNLPSCAEMFTANRGKVVSRGFDLQMAAIIADGLKVGATVGYTDTYYPEAAFGAPINGVAPLLNAAGDKLPNVVPWTAAVNAEYSRDISPLWAGARSYFRIDYRWRSAINPINPNTAGYDPEIDQNLNPSYSVLNLRLGVIQGGLDLSLYLNNATRADPTLSYWHDVSGDPMFYATAIRPLTAGFTGYYRF